MTPEDDRPATGSYASSPRTTAMRDRGRVGYDRARVHAILDEAYFCHLSFIVDAEPRVLPTLHARIGDTVYVHGSTGSRPMLATRPTDPAGAVRDGSDAAEEPGNEDAGLRICLAVTMFDGLVLARSQFHHSVNYRSVIAHGTARRVNDEAEKKAALAALVNKTLPERASETRPPNRRELAETAVLALELREVSVKVRTGGVNDDPDDLGLPYWAGVIPVHLSHGRPEPDVGITAPLPASLAHYDEPVR